MSDLHAQGIIAGCMATFPARFPILISAVESVAPQLDRLYIYVNETMEGLPDLSCFPNVVALDGREHRGDLSANGKIYPLFFLSHCTILTLDDDIVYPPDYVARLTDVLDAFDRHCAVTVHGSILSPNPEWYYTRTRTYAFRQAVEQMRLCALAGSGTFAFHQSTLPVDPESFFASVMVDLRLSLLARDVELPIWVIPRTAEWLRSSNVTGLWEQYQAQITHHTYVARRRDWSFKNFRAVARRRLAEAGPLPDHLRLDPDLARGLATGQVPVDWRPGSVTYRTRSEFLDLLDG